MKLAAVVVTPEVSSSVPVAFFSGSFEERLDKAAALGYDGVELMVREPLLLDTKVLRQQIEKRRLEVAAIATGGQFLLDRLTLLADDSETERRAFERFLGLVRFGQEVGAPLITIGSFRGKLAWAGGDAEASRKRMVDILTRCAEVVGVAGLRLVLEPLNRYEGDFVYTAGEGLALTVEIAHPSFGLLLDTFHVNIEEADPAGAFRTAGPRLWHIHIGDSNRLPPGRGHYDFRKTVSTLREIGYSNYLSAELMAKPDPDTAAQETIHYMRRLVPPATTEKG